jgi:nitrilase
MRTCTLGALQLGSAPEGTAATVDKLLSLRGAILEAGCELLVLPEALLGGYPKGEDFGTRVGYRSDAGREAFQRYWAQAVDLDGPEVAALVELARDCRTALVAGVIERGGATLYCTALLVSEDGRIATHRKLVPTASERLIWGRGDGSTLPVLTTGAGRVGAAICWENYMPLLRTALYAKGIEIWCAPTVDDRDVWQASMRHIACEGRTFLVSACQYLPPPAPAARRDPAWPEDRPLIRGGSVIVSPLGEVLAGPLYGEEGLIAASVDLDDLARARFDLDPVGHYARPDVFRLTVDETPRPAVRTVVDAVPAQEPEA